MFPPAKAHPLLVLSLAGSLAACSARPTESAMSATQVKAERADAGRALPGDPPEAQALRTQLVDGLALEVRSARVLDALRRVPRHPFVPGASLSMAYTNIPLPIGMEQTISQPIVVALMTEALELTGVERVLEIGTGSGYQAAVLAELVAKVYTIEILRPLGEHAREDLARLKVDNVEVRVGDGYEGWPEHAPFDAIIVTAAAPMVPHALYEQLAVGGRMVLPVGDDEQTLQVVTRTADGPRAETLFDVRFGPMLGDWQ